MHYASRNLTTFLPCSSMCQTLGTISAQSNYKEAQRNATKHCCKSCHMRPQHIAMTHGRMPGKMRLFGRSMTRSVCAIMSTLNSCQCKSSPDKPCAANLSLCSFADAIVLQEQQHHLMSSEALGHSPLHGLSEALLCLHLPSNCLLPLQLAASFCQDLGQGQILPLCIQTHLSSY